METAVDNSLSKVFPNLNSPISPFREMAAYEALWLKTNSFKKIADIFTRNDPDSLPSSYVADEEIKEAIIILKEIINKNRNLNFNIIINQTFDYPQRLKDATDPVELLYYSGNIDYLNTRGVAVVGARKVSPEGVLRTKRLVKLLVQDNFTIFSGLAEGVDTAAHTAALENNGRTVAVIGTPLTEYYPKQNKDLQMFIAKKHLLISQVPFIKYKRQSILWNRNFFPERNKTMSALSEATIIVEAGETSGSLIQARAAITQGRKLFILQSCFENKNITWPSRFEEKGAIRVREYEDIRKHLFS